METSLVVTASSLSLLISAREVLTFTTLRLRPSGVVMVSANMGVSGSLR